MRIEFFNNGDEHASSSANTSIYFIGKLLWSGKGFDILLKFQEKFKEVTGRYFPIDIFGAGPDLQYIKTAFRLTDLSKSTKGQSEGQEECLQRKEKAEAFTKFFEDIYTSIPESVLSSGKSLKDIIDEGNPSTVDLITASRFEDSNKSETYQLALLRDVSLGVLQTFRRTSNAGFNFAASVLSSRKSLHKETSLDPIPAKFLGVMDHARISKQYKIFINVSETEVLCTTTAEALAMGNKWVIIPKHTSNEFFMQFTNCLTYSNLNEFVSHLKFALDNDPQKMSNEQSRLLSWEAATERLIVATKVAIDKSDDSSLDEKLRWIHKESKSFFSNQFLRKLIPGSS